ncbi:unnamed protein product, partial [Amoebophrya sp. A25]
QEEVEQGAEASSVSRVRQDDVDGHEEDTVAVPSSTVSTTTRNQPLQEQVQGELRVLG